MTAEVCDRCGVTAAVRVGNRGGAVLAFCQHHYDAVELDLMGRGFVATSLARAGGSEPVADPPVQVVAPARPEPSPAVVTRTVSPYGDGVERVCFTDDLGRLTDSPDGRAAVTIRSVDAAGKVCVFEVQHYRDGVWQDVGPHPALVRYDPAGRPRTVIHATGGKVTDQVVDGAIRAYGVVELDERGEAVRVESWRAGVRLAVVRG